MVKSWDGPEKWVSMSSLLEEPEFKSMMRELETDMGTQLERVRALNLN